MAQTECAEERSKRFDSHILYPYTKVKGGFERGRACFHQVFPLIIMIGEKRKNLGQFEKIKIKVNGGKSEAGVGRARGGE